MVVISPVTIWINGVDKEATILSMSCVNDNLSTSATFLYILTNETNEQLSKGNLTMSGEEYQGWQTNEYAYEWGAQQLNLTILRQVTTTTTTTSTSTAAPSTTTTSSTTSSTTTI